MSMCRAKRQSMTRDTASSWPLQPAEIAVVQVPVGLVLVARGPLMKLFCH